jgi:hypothetical protein
LIGPESYDNRKIDIIKASRAQLQAYPVQGGEDISVRSWSAADCTPSSIKLQATGRYYFCTTSIFTTTFPFCEILQ